MPAISSALIARLRAAADPAADRELLRAFLADRSEPAFAALVRRHGPMVLGVCRRVLGNPHDADDAFQATFLVLARKANAVGQPDHLPGWLHTIAVRTATEIRRMRTRRRKVEVANHECLASECLASRERQRPEGFSLADAPGSPEQSELAALLDEELSRLPEHYRVPVVLCELQGLPRKEAAARLKLPEGTLSSRLAKARKLLADRLTRRGVTATTATITAVLAREATATVPAALAVEAARAALIPAASAVAAQVADGVIKALFVSKLKGVTLAVGMAVLCVGGAVTLPGGLGASNVASVPDESKPEALVQQLGSDSPTDRDAAEKQLRAMGPRALPAVTAGAASSDAEFARRCRSIAAALRADIRTAFHEEFRANGTGTYTHPVWKRYRTIAGDSAASRTLFAAIISDPQRFQRLDDAESDPMAAINAYKTEIARLAASNRAKQDPDASQLPDIAECLLLGSQTITAKAVPHRPPGASVCAERFALLGPRLWKPDALNGPSREPVARLYAAWCDRRALPDVLQFGLDRAINWRISETLPTARRVAQTKDAALPLRASALTLLAHFGTEATDAPAAEVLMDNETVIHTVTYQGVGYITQMRDVATAVRVKLAGRNPKEFGFQTVTGTAFDWSQTPIPAANAFPRGFPTEAARTTAHEKATAFLANHSKPDPKPDPAAEKLVKQLGSPNFADRDTAEKKLKQLGLRAKAAIIAGTKDTDPEIARRSEAVLNHIRREQAWPRFAKLLGDDQHARDLFNVIWAVPRNVELIEKAEEHPESITKLYTDREKEMNEQCRNPDKESWHPGKVSVGEVAGWMYLGTFPGAEKGGSRNVFLLGFPDMWRRSDNAYPFPAALGEGPYKVGARRILVKWIETRIGRPDFSKGLSGAIAYGIPEIVPVAKKYLTDVKEIDDNHRHCLVTIGKCGTKADLPFLARYADDHRVASSVFVNYPGDEANPPREFRPGKDQETQMRDLAMAMTLVLNGATRQQLDEFGFFVSRYWPRYSGAAGSPAPLPPVGKRPHAGNDPFTPSDIGFIHDADREAAHKKAREFLDKQPKPAPKKSDPDPDAEKLVKQLGSPNFTDRDAAEKKLKELGPKAKAAITTGTKDTDPEIARRSAAVLDHIQTAERAAFARQFRDAKENPLAISHPVWDRFNRITGDTKEARALFAAVIANDARFHRLADAEAKPADTARLYAAQFPTAVIVPAGPKGGLLPGKAERIPPDIDPADLAAGFLLGTRPGTSAKLPDRQEEDLDRRKGFVEAMTGPHAAPLRKLYPAWLATRTDADVLGSGLATARACNLTECLLLARKLAADPKAGVRTRADALLVVGQFGGPEDVPLARPLLTETSRYGTFLVGDPSRAQVKDIAAAVMLMVHDQKPWEFGFKCTLPQTKADDRTGRNVTVWGFPSEETRASGHKAVLAYIEAAAKPVAKPAPTAVVGKPADLKQFLADFRADKAEVKDFDHPLWKWFTAAAGKDKAARALFAELVTDPDRADRLAKAAADPTSADKLYAAEVGRVRKFSDDFNEAISVRWKEIADPAERTQAMMKAHEDAAANPPVGEVAAILFLGTLPSTADVSLGERPKRLGLDVSPVGLPMRANDKFLWAPAVRRLFASWLAARHLTEDQESGLAVASTVGIRETLPLARRWAADPLQPPKVRGMALAVVGHFGTAADRPLADALHNDGTSIGGSITVVQNVAGARKESQRYWATVGDVALAVSVHLAGGDPFTFGCGPPGEKSLNLAWGSLGYLGFADEESREAGHKKAKAWLTQGSQPWK